MKSDKASKCSACISRDGSEHFDGGFGWMGRQYPYVTAKFEAKTGKAEDTQTITGLSSWKFATVTLHNHRVAFVDEPMRSVEVGCEIAGAAGASVNVHIWVEAHSTVDDSNAHWNGEVMAMIDWYG